jgi:hypothetical protein
MFLRITPIVIAAVLLSACSTAGHVSSRDSTSAGGTATGGGDSTYHSTYYNYSSTTQPGYSESGDIPSQ